MLQIVLLSNHTIPRDQQISKGKSSFASVRNGESSIDINDMYSFVLHPIAVSEIYCIYLYLYLYVHVHTQRKNKCTIIVVQNVVCSQPEE